MKEEHEDEPIRIGLVAEEPIRREGLLSVFDLPGKGNLPPLCPVPGTLHELLAHTDLHYLVLDLNSMAGYSETLEVIRHERPDVRLIVIGPANDDQVVISSIIAGARAHLDLNANPETVRLAIEVVVSGSIWAPRRLLSRLIDRLLTNTDTSLTAGVPQLTERERQVLELILLARSNREIAHQLGIEERTVKAYVGRLMRKAGADNRIKLSMSALGLSVKRKKSEMMEESCVETGISPVISGN